MKYSVGSYGGISETVEVTLEPKNFAQYGNFYDKNGAWWATGDTLRGPFHTNDWLRVYGTPVFLLQKKVLNCTIQMHILNFMADSKQVYTFR